MKEIWEVEKKDEGKVCTLLSFLIQSACPFIAKPRLLHCERSERQIRLLLDFESLRDKATLHTFLQATPNISRELRRVLAFQLVQACAYMQECGVCHQFLSSDDLVLVFPDGDRDKPVMKILNFFGCIAANTAYSCVRNYRPPEVAVQLAKVHKDKVDDWAIGCLLFEILTSHAPFTLVSSRDDYGAFRPQLLKQQLEAIVRTIGPLADDDIAPEYPPRIKQFLLKMKVEPLLSKEINESCDGGPAAERWGSVIGSLLQFNPVKRKALKDVKLDALFEGLQLSEWETTPLPLPRVEDYLSS